MCRIKFIWFRIFLFFVGVIAALLLPRVKSTSAAPPPARKSVIVELFTSEGCSSCPPADELLGRLRSESRPDGVEVIPLGFHVDYWNFQGWTDRFSSVAYSQRQFKYAQRLHVESPYTPELVFDGAVESEGDDAPRAHALINREAQRPATAEVQLGLTGDNQLHVSANGAHDLAGDVILAYTEDNLASKVKAGENNGRELRHWAVVRELKTLGRIRNGSFDATIPLKLNKEWKRNDVRAVAFVQEQRDGAIDGAAALALGAPSKE